jgi:glutamate/tyrosine decarboxylase-like PLP-dependent enzyme
VYAALRQLGRAGLADLVDRCCDHARLIADRLAAEPDIDIVNDVVLNQVLVRFGDDDALTRAVIEQVQRDRTCWLAGSTFRGRFVMRISIVGWQTTTSTEAPTRSSPRRNRCAAAGHSENASDRGWWCVLLTISPLGGVGRRGRHPQVVAAAGPG